MNDIREIVTKAVIAKGKKTINLEEKVKPENKVYSVLGCWIINHEFEAHKNENTVIINGEFELNIWTSHNNNAKTDVNRKKVKYQTEIITKQIVSDYIENSDDVLARIIQHPTCVNAKIVDDIIELDIVFQIVAEVIGETKMQVTVFNQTESWEPDYENEIDENFLKKE